MITVATKNGITLSDLLNGILTHWYNKMMEGASFENFQIGKEEMITQPQVKYMRDLCRKNGIDMPQDYKKMTMAEAWKYINALVEGRKSEEAPC